MQPLRHDNDDTLLLDVDQSILLFDLCLKAWARGVDTYDIARAASFRLARVIPESFVANLLADYWRDSR